MIGKQLKILKTYHNLSYTDLSALLGIEIMDVILIEENLKHPTRSIINKITALFSISDQFLYTGIPKYIGDFKYIK